MATRSAVCTVPFAFALAATVFQSALGQSAAASQSTDDIYADFSIVKGEEVNPSEYPEVVRIVSPTRRGKQSVCGGTILNSEWVLTAAHCFSDLARGSVVVRTFYGTNARGQAAENITYANGVYVHPDYERHYATGGPTRGQYDVALVKLVKPLETDPGEALPVVSLPSAGVPLPRGGQGTVVGRGAHRWTSRGYSADPIRLRKAEIPILDQCDSETEICAQYPVHRQDIPRDADVPELDGDTYRNPSSCYGDSGGPLYVLDGGNRQQVGIVSHHRVNDSDSQFFGSDLCGRATVWYTSLSFVRPWMDAVMAAPLQPGDRAPRVPLPVPPYGNDAPQRPTPPMPDIPQPPTTQPPITQPPAATATPQPPTVQPPVVPPAVVPPSSRPSDRLVPEPSVQPLPAPSATPDGRAEPTLPFHPGDSALLAQVPAVYQAGRRTKAAIWAIDGARHQDGSDLAIGAARMRGAALGQSTQAAQSLAILASEERVADALASGPLQSVAPLYLNQSSALEPAVLRELTRTGVKEVWLLGGDVALSPQVETSLQAAGLATRRIAGATRIDTAIAIAKHMRSLGLPVTEQFYVARAFGDQGNETRTWADALALGALAANQQTPILLTASDQLSPAVRDYAQAGDRAVVVGGSAAVSDAALVQLQARVTLPVARLAGSTRAQTATALISQYHQPKQVVVIDGQQHSAWQAGFALAGLAGALNAPVVLTMGDAIPDETKAVLANTKASAVMCVGKAAVCQEAVKLAN